MTRRGFIGLVASAVGATAMPALGWFDAEPPAVAATTPAAILRYLVAVAGAGGGRIVVSLCGDVLIDLAINEWNQAHWFGDVIVRPGAKLDVEVEGDVKWSVAAEDGQAFKWNAGKEDA